jgi:hypothetical protein
MSGSRRPFFQLTPLSKDHDMLPPQYPKERLGEVVDRRASGEAIGAYLRVTLDGNAVWMIAGDEAYFGTCLGSVPSGVRARVRDKRSAGVHFYVAGDAIAVGDEVSTAAAGKVVTGTGGAVTIGVALSAGGDGDLIEVMPA